MIEKVVGEEFQRFLDYTSSTSLMSPFQSGFCPSHRMEMALGTFTDYLHRQLDQSKSVLIVLLYLNAAFNTVLTHCFATVGVHWVVL